VPAIYLNDWPDRYIHTHADAVGNIDPTKLLRAAFIGAASGYYLATVGEDQVPALLGVVRRHALERTATALGRAAELDDEAEAASLLRHHAARESAVLQSIGSIAPWPAASLETVTAIGEEIASLVERDSTAPSEGDSATGPDAGSPTAAAGATDVCWRRRHPKGPLWGFGYSWFEDHFRETGLAPPGLLSWEGRWGGGSESAYEVLNLIDGQRSVAEVRDEVAAAYGPVPLALVREYVAALEAMDVVHCDVPDGPGGSGTTRGLAGMLAASTAPLAERAPRFPPPSSAVELNLGGFTKVLCSAVFVSGREVEEAIRNSAGPLFLMPGHEPGPGDVEVDEARREVRALRDGRVVRTARFYGDQGCVSLPPGRGETGGGEIGFTPVAVVSALPDAATTHWPLGDLGAAIDPAEVGIDRAALEAAVDLAFADPEALTQAMVVVHRGRILAERYAPGLDPDTQLESWSMGKSLGATLIGVLVEQGALDLDEPPPIAAWQEPGDPRSGIRLIDLVRMSSGLEFYSHHDRDWTPELGYPEHFYVYTGGLDVFDFSVSRPPLFPPGTEGRYHNSDPLTLSGLVRQVVTGRGEEYLTFPQRALFDRIGIRRQVLEPDVAGTFVISGYDYGTPRNWARLGLLYLDDGVFAGERILPEGWVDSVRTPAPAWRSPVYGGSFWLNRTGNFSLPADAYFMAGAGSQYTIIVPSLDLVIVRMGHLRGGGPGNRALDRALGALWELLG
jgi:CubicO group peptidase (beta-lactamase class C family)